LAYWSACEIPAGPLPIMTLTWGLPTPFQVEFAIVFAKIKIKNLIM
jgi:hypothetical protein